MNFDSVKDSPSDMMRYQRVSSPDCFPLGGGGGGGGGSRKPTLRACKEDDSDSSARISTNFSTSFDARPLRARSASGSGTPDRSPYSHFQVTEPDLRPAAEDLNGLVPAGVDVLPQWGQRKRSRVSRPAADEFSGGNSRKVIRIQRRSAAASASVMPPPPPGGAYVRGANLRPCTPVRDSTSPLLNRSVDDRSGKRSPPSPPPAKTHKRACSDAVEKVNLEPKQSSDHDAAEKVSQEVFEWPRIHIALSRKEKEDDFMAMKGTKLPQRPKKRAKNVEKTLQYCFPGMWLSDLTRSRYEVREKKCAKKKRRGLKGMENMESDSE